MDEKPQEAEVHTDRRVSRAVLFFVALNLSYFTAPSCARLEKWANEEKARIERKAESLLEEAGSWMSGRKFVDKSFQRKPRMRDSPKRIPLKLRRC